MIYSHTLGSSLHLHFCKGDGMGLGNLCEEVLFCLLHQKWIYYNDGGMYLPQFLPTPSLLSMLCLPSICLPSAQHIDNCWPPSAVDTCNVQHPRHQLQPHGHPAEHEWFWWYRWFATFISTLQASAKSMRNQSSESVLLMMFSLQISQW